jgi:hypothetical protein
MATVCVAFDAARAREQAGGARDQTRDGRPDDAVASWWRDGVRAAPPVDMLVAQMLKRRPAAVARVVVGAAEAATPAVPWFDIVPLGTADAAAVAAMGRLSATIKQLLRRDETDGGVGVGVESGAERGGRWWWREVEACWRAMEAWAEQGRGRIVRRDFDGRRGGGRRRERALMRYVRMREGARSRWPGVVEWVYGGRDGAGTEAVGRRWPGGYHVDMEDEVVVAEEGGEGGTGEV